MKFLRSITLAIVALFVTGSLFAARPSTQAQQTQAQQTQAQQAPAKPAPTKTRTRGRVQNQLSKQQQPIIQAPREVKQSITKLTYEEILSALKQQSTGSAYLPILREIQAEAERKIEMVEEAGRRLERSLEDAKNRAKANSQE